MTLISEDVFSLGTQQSVRIEEKEVTFEKKPMIIKEKQVIVGGVEKNISAAVREDEDWFVLFSPAQIEKKATDTGIVNEWYLPVKFLFYFLLNYRILMKNFASGKAGSTFI